MLLVARNFFSYACASYGHIFIQKGPEMLILNAKKPLAALLSFSIHMRSEPATFGKTSIVQIINCQLLINYHYMFITWSSYIYNISSSANLNFSLISFMLL